MRITKLLGIAFLSLFLSNCSSDSDSPPVDGDNDNDNPQFAMTFKLNGELHQKNNAFGGNESTPNLFTYYPDEEFIRLQGTSPWGASDGIEINLMIKRTDLVEGVYQVNTSTDRVTTHIDLINNTNGQESENTHSGTITITDVDTTNKTVKGTFEFSTVNIPDATPVVTNFEVTEGTFNYRYDVPE